MGQELAKALVRAGHDVHVCHRDERHAPSRSFTLDGVVIHHFDDRLMLGSMHAADIVMTQCLPSALSVVHGTARAMGKPIAMLVHSDFHQVLSRWRDAKPELTIFNSRWLRDVFLTYRRDFDYVVVNPVNRFPVEPLPPGDKVTMVNLSHAKGVDVFAEIAPRMPDIDFMGIAGGYGNQQLVTTPNSIMYPPTDDMRAVYEQSKLVIMPSRYESWGLVPMEAASFGRPSVVIDTPGLRENVGDSAVLVKSHDPAAWVAGIEEALTDYDALTAKALVRAAHHHEMTTTRLAAFVAAVETIGGV